MLALVLDVWRRESLGVVRGRKQSVTLGTFCLTYALGQAPGLHSLETLALGGPHFCLGGLSETALFLVHYGDISILCPHI